VVVSGAGDGALGRSMTTVWELEEAARRFESSPHMVELRAAEVGRGEAREGRGAGAIRALSVLWVCGQQLDRVHLRVFACIQTHAQTHTYPHVSAQVLNMLCLSAMGQFGPEAAQEEKGGSLQ
jgi:hypothetical protein